MDELKECPFCGGRTVICAPIEGIVGYVIKCETVNCCEMTSSDSDNLDQLKARWNQRHLPIQSSGRGKLCIFDKECSEAEITCPQDCKYRR